MLRSREPEASQWPSGEKASCVTVRLCASKGGASPTHFAVSQSQMPAVAALCALQQVGGAQEGAGGLGRVERAWLLHGGWAEALEAGALLAAAEAGTGNRRALLAPGEEHSKKGVGTPPAAGWPAGTAAPPSLHARPGGSPGLLRLRCRHPNSVG